MVGSPPPSIVATIELYHPKTNPGMLIPKVFLANNELHKMRASSVHIVRTLAPDFGKLCDQMNVEKSKLIIQQIPDETHWKVHVIRDGRVGTCTTAGCNLIEALHRARSAVSLQPAQVS